MVPHVESCAQQTFGLLEGGLPARTCSDPVPPRVRLRTTRTPAINPDLAASPLLVTRCTDPRFDARNAHAFFLPPGRSPIDPLRASPRSIRRRWTRNIFLAIEPAQSVTPGRLVSPRTA